MTSRGHSAESRPRVILFLGAPGSGKGTQSSWLASKLGMPCLSTGDMLRAEAVRKTPAGRKLRRILASGALAGDEVVCDAVKSRLERELPNGGLILDGFPRTLKQAECLDSILRGLRMPQPTVLHLDVSRERLLERLTARRHCASCGAIYNVLTRPSSLGTRCENDDGTLLQREDDSEGVILRRLEAFDLSCAPLLDYYSHGDYHWIDGDRPAEVVSRELLSILKPGKIKSRKTKSEKGESEKTQAAA